MGLFNLIVILVALAVIGSLVVTVRHGRPKQPPHTPGSLVGTYKRGGRGYQGFVNRRIRSGRPRRR